MSSGATSGTFQFQPHQIHQSSTNIFRYFNTVSMFSQQRLLSPTPTIEWIVRTHRKSPFFSFCIERQELKIIFSFDQPPVRRLSEFIDGNTTVWAFRLFLHPFVKQHIDKLSRIFVQYLMVDFLFRRDWLSAERVACGVSSMPRGLAASRDRRSHALAEFEVNENELYEHRE